MEITAQMVMQLREKTGVSMMACKRALTESNGDMDQAIDILRKSGEAKAASKADRVTNEGGIFLEQSSDKIAVATLKCETDFVARSDDFINAGKELAKITLNEGADAARAKAPELTQGAVLKLGENITLENAEVFTGSNWGSYVHSTNKVAGIVSLENGTAEQARDVAMHGVATNPKYILPTEVQPADIDHEKEIARAQLIADGKPEAMIDKILEGKIKKFSEENALTTQPFVKDPSMTVQKYLGDAKVTTFKRFSL